LNADDWVVLRIELGASFVDFYSYQIFVELFGGTEKGLFADEL